ncbi:unnamed protein product [Amoebophrya sp. A120]|nr:unnamed protein product [Amoebophrya sp. A120]|eukprot:GSA120T00011425001.1
MLMPGHRPMVSLPFSIATGTSVSSTGPWTKVRGTTTRSLSNPPAVVSNPFGTKTALPPVKHFSSQRYCVHDGDRLQAALVLERLPTEFVEPPWARRWRLFQADWKQRTGNDLDLADELAYMHFPTQFLDKCDEEQWLNRQKEGNKESTTDTRTSGTSNGGAASREDEPQISELEQLLAPTDPFGSGLAVAGGDGGMTIKGMGRGKKARSKSASRAADGGIDSGQEGSLRSLTKAPRTVLYLLVKYRGTDRWTFPRANVLADTGMRHTLELLAHEQLGMNDLTFVGKAPASFERFVSRRKVFYYRGRVTPQRVGTMTVPEESPVEDYAWVERAKLSAFVCKRIIRTCWPMLLETPLYGSDASARTQG